MFVKIKKVVLFLNNSIVFFCRDLVSNEIQYLPTGLFSNTQKLEYL